jgi:AcrR family transcriptional regulator
MTEILSESEVLSESEIRTEQDALAPADRPQRADARRNRERILESARAAFAEYGPEAQIDDVARHAGVGVGTVYRHFPTKEALLTELVRQKFRLFADRAREALESEGEPFAVIEGLLRANAETAATDVGTQYAIANAGEQTWTQAQAEQEELIVLTGELISRALRAGAIRPDIEAMDIAMLMCGVCTTMGTRPGFDWRRHLELVVDALRPR